MGRRSDSDGVASDGDRDRNDDGRNGDYGSRFGL